MDRVDFPRYFLPLKLLMCLVIRGSILMGGDYLKGRKLWLDIWSYFSEREL